MSTGPAPSTPAASPAVASATSWATLPPPTPPRRARRWAVIGLVAAVVIVVVLAALFATGLLFRSSSGSGANPLWETYSEAEQRASGAASGTSGGPWVPVSAFAFALPYAALVPAANLTALLHELNCSIRWTGGAAPTLTLPGTPSTAGVGRSGFWLVAFRGSGDELLLASVSEGNATVLLTAGGASCSSDISALAGIPGDVVDSPIAVANASAAGAGAFLASHGNATQTWVLIGSVDFGIVESAPTWSILDTTCSIPSSANEVGATFNVTLSALTGIVSRAGTTGTVNCELTVPTGLSLLEVPLGPALGAAKAI